MDFGQPDKNFDEAEKLSHSLTFEEIKDDYEYFQLLIYKHHPDGNFRIIQDVLPANGREGLHIRPSMAVVEFMQYLILKYKDGVRARAVSSKIYRDFLMKK